MISCSVTTESWDYQTPFRIARGVADALDVIVVELRDATGHIGRGEAAGVDYDGDLIGDMVAQIEAFGGTLPTGLDRTALLDVLPAGGARNALDCALWDLEAKASGVPAWQTAGLTNALPVTTASTIGIGTPDEVWAKALTMTDWPLIKIKVDGDSHIELIRIVHDICPAARLIVDANQAWSFAQLDALAPELATLGVALIEQPLAKGNDGALRAYRHAVPLAADESCTDRASVAALAGLYHFVNIKLDKTGGLTEALAVAAAARQHQLGIMIGCMAGTSLAMAPAAIIAQQAGFVDLDGPLLHTNDRLHGLKYKHGAMEFPEPALWG
ncbi:dipeptide epimerase [Sphingomonas sp. 28-63-12]|uniref:N-acetyl-D-Glu racemase DgcA n=1 Tax=Sphingomonas sp. 28-63-12 TaxID=1970434 RepID=UPI000BD8DE92|nr:MAG: hypothetical protein B7Y47_11205 [Sphingomonas sp. 28-63-12]